MPELISPSAGQTLGSIAGKVLGDSSRFREIADLNDLNPLDDLSALSISVPLISELQQIEPALTRIRTGIDATLAQAQEIATRAQGYSETARNAVGEVNNIFNTVESTLDSALEFIASAQNEVGQTVDWLLDKSETLQSGITNVASTIEQTLQEL